MTATMLAFATGALASWGLALLVPAEVVRLLRRRLQSDPDGQRAPRSKFPAVVLGALAAIGRRLAPAARTTASKDLEARVAAAGLAGGAGPRLGTLDARELLAAKLAAATLVGVGSVLLGAAAPGRLGIVVAVIAPMAAFFGPDLWLVRRARERTRAVRRELPELLDLLRVTIDAGLSLPAAMSAVGERTRGILGAEWRVVGREVALGVPLSEALRSMLARVPTPEVAGLVGALERSLRHGTPLAETLGAQAGDARASRRRRIHEDAARAGPKIQLVVALLLVPSVLLLVAAALVTALLDGETGLTGF